MTPPMPSPGGTQRTCPFPPSIFHPFGTSMEKEPSFAVRFSRGRSEMPRGGAGGAPAFAAPAGSRTV